MEEITEINISYICYRIEEKICLLISEITFLTPLLHLSVA